MSVRLKRIRIRLQRKEYDDDMPEFEVTGWEPSHLYEPTKEDWEDARLIAKYINACLKQCATGKPAAEQK